MDVRLGIIGCGAIAEAMHIPAAQAVPGVKLMALVDSNLDRATALGRKHKVPHVAPVLEDVREFVDAVVICTPPHLHAEMAQAALRNGLHVLCEKPMANSAAECHAMAEAAVAANRILAVAHIFRFWPSRQAVKTFLHEGKLGAIKSVHLAQGNPYSWQTLTGYNMRRELVPGGVLIDAGIHPLDTLLWWFGDPLDFEYEDDALGGLESNARLRLTFPGGVKGGFRLSRTCSLPNEFRIVAEHGTLVLSAYKPYEFTVQRHGKGETIKTSERPMDAGYCEQCQLRDFVESIQSQRPPKVTGMEGARVVTLIEQCYQRKRSRPVPQVAPIPGLTW